MTVASPQRIERADGAPGCILIVGSGLIGASIGLGLRIHGIDVLLTDTSPTVVALARDVGAGRPLPAGTEPDLVIVATPPDVTAAEVARALQEYPDAVVTDVSSVKAPIVAAIATLASNDRYVGGHPMAGRERSGPLAARADLFEGRPWVLTPTATTAADSLRMVADLARLLGAVVIEIDAASHDEAVAVTSHLPQLASSLVAARLIDAGEPATALSGQGLRDVTRLAGSDPVLWAQILAANADPVRRALRAVRADLDGVIDALDALADGVGDQQVGARASLATIMRNGNEGRALIPGKHGTGPSAFATVLVRVPDRPGEIARLLTEVGEAEINLEDIRVEHSLGRPTGVVEIAVAPAVQDPLAAALRRGGWIVVQ